MAETTEAQDRPIVTLEQARAAGLKRYYTGKACKFGHINERYAGTRSCVDCSSTNYMKWRTENPDKYLYGKARWRAENPDKVKDQRVRYAADNPDKLKEQRVRSSLRNSVNRKASAFRWRLQNSDKIKAYSSYYRVTNLAAVTEKQARWRSDNREKIRLYNSAWREANPGYEADWRRSNPEQTRAKSAARRARKQNAEGTYTAEEIAALAIRQRYRCANPSCRVSIRKSYHADHIIALTRGGSNWISNIQLLCARCNLRKNAKEPLIWARENGLLL